MSDSFPFRNKRGKPNNGTPRHAGMPQQQWSMHSRQDPVALTLEQAQIHKTCKTHAKNTEQAHDNRKKFVERLAQPLKTNQQILNQHELESLDTGVNFNCRCPLDFPNPLLSHGNTDPKKPKYKCTCMCPENPPHWVPVHT